MIKSISLALLFACFICIHPIAAAQSGNSKPITRNGLTKALQIGGLPEKELLDQISRRGVDFTLNSSSETDLRQAGADDAVIDAVRSHYRSSSGIADSDSSSRGNPSGALSALDLADPAPAPVHTSAHSSGGGSPSRPVMTLRDVHKLYIDKMPNGLDGYLRAAISHKLGSYFSIVLDRSDADAILQSSDARSPGAVSIVDPSGKTLLWSGSADDKEKVYLNFRHGGQRELAEKLAGQLKKYLD